MPSLVGGLAAGALFMGSGVLIQQVSSPAILVWASFAVVARI
jgi:hypothetical protein